MIKILIVDDEYEKVGDIKQVLDNGSPNVFAIDHVTTAVAARKAMLENEYELVLLDLNLPNAVGSPPTPNGGLQLFDLIKLDSKVRLPADVIFVTAREELIESASQDVQRRGGVLVQYGVGNDNWRGVLSGRAEYAKIRRSRESVERADVAIITALRTPELSAVLDLDYDWKSLRVDGDPINYHRGQIDVGGASLRVVAASAQRKGMPSSAALAARMELLFRPKYLFMLGICAGRRGKTNYGDVIVADPAWDWGSGKSAVNDVGSRVFMAAPHQSQLRPMVAQAAVELAQDDSLISRILARWRQDVPQGRLAVRVGPMASGASVVSDNSTVGEIAVAQRDLLAVDMEAYAVMAACEYVSVASVTPVVIKSVCDFADPEKGDDWQAYASFTSASFFDELVRSGRLDLGR